MSIVIHLIIQNNFGACYPLLNEGGRRGRASHFSNQSLMETVYNWNTLEQCAFKHSDDNYRVPQIRTDRLIFVAMYIHQTVNAIGPLLAV